VPFASIIDHNPGDEKLPPPKPAKKKAASDDDDGEIGNF
jgi:hypothetical protein